MVRKRLTTIRHINCGTLLVASYPTVVCHCLLLEDAAGLALVDTGIGLADVRDPVGRLGRPLVDGAGFQFNEADTAVRRIEAAGFSPGDVRHVVLTHGDPDHAGGLADFPGAVVHISEEEKARIDAGVSRYAATQFAHGLRWKSYGRSDRRWFGLEARAVELGFAGLGFAELEFAAEVLLVPLFGHTAGHCGVAIQQGGRWLLHAGDAYYLRAELTQDDHPVSQLAAARADDDGLRRASLAELRRLVRDHGDEVDVIGYHDVTELPGGTPYPGRA
jgi:glyoxylase-like metal-dependent hydrolase (beta-lactamase superfamily II)